jgi:uncharacterized protein YmfQ (DUF2313 family)
MMFSRTVFLLAVSLLPLSISSGASAQELRTDANVRLLETLAFADVAQVEVDPIVDCFARCESARNDSVRSCNSTYQVNVNINPTPATIEREAALLTQCLADNESRYQNDLAECFFNNNHLSGYPIGR